MPKCAIKLTYSNLDFPQAPLSGEGVRERGNGEWNRRQRKEGGKGWREGKGKKGKCRGGIEALPKQKLIPLHL